MFTPSSRISPSVGTYNRVISLIKVVLPEPFAPTMQSFYPQLILRLRCLKEYVSLPGYLKDTSLNSMTECFWNDGLSLPLFSSVVGMLRNCFISSMCGLYANISRYTLKILLMELENLPAADINMVMEPIGNPSKITLYKAIPYKMPCCTAPVTAWTILQRALYFSWRSVRASCAFPILVYLF